jgi:penicillin-binding protein 1B
MKIILQAAERIGRWVLRGSIKMRLLKAAVLGLAVLSIGLSLYCLYLSIKIERRFSGRRWSIPSKVLSDTTMLYPGQPVNRMLFAEKLKHLGYREAPHAPSRKGEMRTQRSAIDIFLHDLQTQSRKREGFPIRITFWRNEIGSILNLRSGESIPILELEPEEIALLFGPERERRQLVSIDQVPQHLIDAALSAEDRRFYSHHGIDPRGILRALYANIRRGSISQGGSTITQQLAKCYFLYPKRSLTRKVREAFMALIIEMKYEKNEILEIYLNEIYLGQRGSVSINGVGEASNFYFGKPVGELSISEAACMAGLIKAPNHYSPYVDKERCREQRDKILHTMRKFDFISEAELNTALSSPIRTAGVADFGRTAPYFVNYLTEQLASLYSPEDLASLGLSISTTLDTQVQMAAERALDRGLARLEKSIPALDRSEPGKKIQGAVIVIQPKTGYILALVGGRNYDVSQFNRVTQALRQPGSAFKPFVYLSGLGEFTPVSRLSNEPVSYEVDGELWEPENYAPIPEDSLPMRDALARSVNLATVDLAMRVGLEHVVDTAVPFGFTTPIRPYPSLALGAFEVKPIELARAYCAFAADGVLPYPLSLKDVVDEKGEPLQRRHVSIERVTSPEKAFIMTSMLRSVVTDGTARSLGALGISFPVAGKTGTTNNSRDAWFVGYTPRVLALVWIGFDDGSSIAATGAGAALPVWADLMNAIPQYTSGDWFSVPPGVVKRTVCLDSGGRAVRGCPRKREEVFLEGTAPKQYCPIHSDKGLLQRILESGEDIINDL